MQSDANLVLTMIDNITAFDYPFHKSMRYIWQGGPLFTCPGPAAKEQTSSLTGGCG